MTIHIQILSGSRAGQVQELHAPGGSIGREADNLLCLPDPTVSAHHAQLRSDGENWWIQDLKSTNKSWMEDVPLDQGAVLLRPSGHLLLGRIELEYRIEPERPSLPRLADLPTVILNRSLARDGLPADEHVLPDSMIPLTYIRMPDEQPMRSPDPNAMAKENERLRAQNEQLRLENESLRVESERLREENKRLSLACDKLAAAARSSPECQ